MNFLISLVIFFGTASVFATEKMSYIEYSLKKAEKIKYENLENYKKQTLKKKETVNEDTTIVPSQNGRILQEVSTSRAGRTRIIENIQQPAMKRIGNDLSFSYYAQFLGPSLGGDYQSGATYNRFNTGQDYKGDPLDATGSYQIFHALTIGYQLSTNTKLYYGYTFQDDINEGIKYRTKNFDGSYSEWERGKGPSDNNKRMGVTFFNVINNDYVGLSLNTFYEFPSTLGSVNSDMSYGLGIAPTLSIKSNIAGLSYGISGEIQRNFYEDQEYYTRFSDGTRNNIPTRHQTLLINISPYLNYIISDLVTFRTALQFDWDQRGDQVNTFEDYNKNLDDIAKIGLGFNMGSGISTGIYLDIAIEDPSIEKTALGASVNFNVF